MAGALALALLGSSGAPEPGGTLGGRDKRWGDAPAIVQNEATAGYPCEASTAGRASRAVASGSNGRTSVGLSVHGRD